MRCSNEHAFLHWGARSVNSIIKLNSSYDLYCVVEVIVASSLCSYSSEPRNNVLNKGYVTFLKYHPKCIYKAFFYYALLTVMQ